jgi:tRNA threonylcarbamoyladenosine biosynthesis protein TsaB
MYILAIETTGKAGSVALVACKLADDAASEHEVSNGCAACAAGSADKCGNGEPQVLASKKIEGSMSHLRELVPSVSAVLDEADISKNEISYIATSIGPGSFTGIRIGVSTARALSQALGLEYAIAVPSLTGFMYKPAAREAKATGKVICAIINARRGQVYGRLDGYMDDGPYMLADMLDVIRERVFAEGREVVFFGDGIDAYESQINDGLAGLGKYEFASENIRLQDAENVALCAAENLDKYMVKASELLPDYMRKAEAEQKLAAGQLPICKGPKQE